MMSPGAELAVGTVPESQCRAASLPPYEGNDLEPGIAPVVYMLREWGIDTFYSCEGGEGHSCRTPTVLFKGDEHHAFQAIALVNRFGYRVLELQKVWLFSGLELHAMPRPTWRLSLCPWPLSPAMPSESDERRVSS